MADYNTFRNILLGIDIIIGVIYLSLLVTCDYEQYKTPDIKFFIKFFFVCLIALQGLLIFLNYKNNPQNFQRQD